MLAQLSLYWEIMTWRDMMTLLLSMTISLTIGGTILYFFFRFLGGNNNNNNNNNNQQHHHNINNEDYNHDQQEQQQQHKLIVHGEEISEETRKEILRRISATPAHQALAAENLKKKKQQQQGRNGDDNNNATSATTTTTSPAEAKQILQRARRNIPVGSSAVLVRRGQRLVEEGSYDEALVCFLALLYSAVESGDATTADQLPAHLAECLRGAGICYRRMGQVEIAAKFLQAERLIYEEMVASLEGRIDPKKKKNNNNNNGNSNGNDDDDEEEQHVDMKSRAIVANLFKDPDAEDVDDALALPRRCRVLKEVAAQCMKHGHVQVALSYQLKMAAVKRKVSGKAMEPGSDEFNSIAEMLQKLSASDFEEASRNMMSGGGGEESQRNGGNNNDNDSVAVVGGGGGDAGGASAAAMRSKSATEAGGGAASQ